MIVVSNTSPLTNLAAIGQFGLLQYLYGELWIADAVWTELNAFGKRWPGRDDVDSAAWIKRRHVQDRPLVTSLQRDLQLGEAESIALGVELHADLILLDEKEGRHAAQQLGLRVLGVVGILLVAKSLGKIERIRPLLDDLRQVAGFYVSDSLYQEALRQAGEAG